MSAAPRAPSSQVAVGLGANLGDRRATLVRAVRELARMPLSRVTRVSSIWETDPVGGPPQPQYFNAVAALATELSPHALLEHLLDLERRFGRVRGVRNGPRTLDLDLLWIDGRIVDDPPRLIVPHPRLVERAFALSPLIEILADARDPATGELYARTLEAVGRTGVRKLRPPLDAPCA